MKLQNIFYIILFALVALLVLKSCADKKTNSAGYDQFRKTIDSLTALQKSIVKKDSVLRINYGADTVARLKVIDSLTALNELTTFQISDYKKRIKVTVDALTDAITNQPDKLLSLRFDSLKAELSQTGNALNFWQLNTSIKDSLLYALHQTDALVIAAKNKAFDSLAAIHSGVVQAVDRLADDKFYAGLGAGFSNGFASGGVQLLYQPDDKVKYTAGIEYTTLNSFYLHIGLLKPLKF
jgi:hypothetical protein